MLRVTLSGKVLAESDKTVVVENNHYFPPTSVNKDLLSESKSSSVCPWKGTASYYNAEFSEGEEKVKIDNVAWYYPDPKEKAQHIKDYVAFYKNKVVIEEGDK